MVRHKNRYMLIEIIPQSSADNALLKLKPISLHLAIMNKIQQLYGEFGVAAVKSGFTSKYCNELTKIALIRSRHGPHKFVCSAISCIDKIEGQKFAVNTLYTGATIRQCFKFLMKYQQMKFDESCINLKTDEEKKELSDMLLSCKEFMEVT